MPRLLKRFLLRLRATLSAHQDRDTRAELDLHLRLLEEEYLAKGVAPEDARRLARREFGNPAVFQDASRDLFSFHLIEDLIRDLRHAGREMRRSAGFTAIAVGLARRRHRCRHRDICRDRGRHAAAAPRAQP